MTLREFIAEASEEGPDSILWKRLSKKPKNSDIVDEYKRSPRKYALINKSTGEILEISNSSKISTAGYANSQIKKGDDVIILNLTTNEIEELELKDSIFEASGEESEDKYKKFKEKEGKEVVITVKSGARYAGKLSHVKISPQRNFLVLVNLRIINQSGGETVSKRDRKRTFELAKIASIKTL